MKLTRSHDSYMKEVLANREEASAYLNAAADAGELKYLLVAIRRIVGANGGMGALAKAVGMSRTTLYKTLSPKGNPGIETLRAILGVYGLRLGFFPEPETGSRHRPSGRPSAHSRHTHHPHP